MTSVPLGQQAYNRQYAQEPEIEMLNRFLEKNPTNLVEQVALLARPGDKLLRSFGAGRPRIIAHQPGVFNDDLFVVMGDTLFRWDGIGAPISISEAIQGTGDPSIAFVAGTAYDHMFISDGVTLRYYDGIAAASGTLSIAGGSIVNTDMVVIDNTHYQWTSTSVDAGAPIGTLANPWGVDLGNSDTDALGNLIKALNATGIPGTDYSTAILPHLTVEGVISDATAMGVKARVRGAGGNTIMTTETGANISWAAVTLLGGGDQKLNPIIAPGGAATISLDTLKSFVVVVLSNSQRFYWINPGSLTIDPLDFAEVESEPDELVEAKRVGDHIFLLGITSAEIWYVNPQVDILGIGSRFIPQQGLSFGQGVIAGTSVVIRNQLYVVSEDGIGYTLVGGPKRVTNHGVEERIRLAREAQGI